MGHGNQLVGMWSKLRALKKKKKKKKNVKILSEGYNSAKFCSENFPLYGRRPGCRVSKLNVVVQGDSSFFAK